MVWSQAGKMNAFQLLTILPFATGFKKSFLSSDIMWAVFKMRLPTLTDVLMGRQLALLTDVVIGWLKQEVTGRIVFCSSLRRKVSYTNIKQVHAQVSGTELCALNKYWHKLIFSNRLNIFLWNGMLKMLNVVCLIFKGCITDQRLQNIKP